MNLVLAFLLITILILFTTPFLPVKAKGIVFFLAILVNAALSGFLALNALIGSPAEFIFAGSWVTGPIALRIDALSGWFVLIINFVFVTGGFYGLFYMNSYREQKTNLTLHGIGFILLHAALIALSVIQNSIAFLVAWEIMALSAFISVIFEHEKVATIKAGINYLIHSHVSLLFLMLGFMWVASKTGSYDFAAIATYTANHNGADSLALFLFFFFGFAIKAGFVPFHTWLPYAHPAAPAHISGVMSGVMIKIGIYGILRMILLIKADYTAIGHVIIVFSVISGMYGVMLAIIQHNLKRLLAYHSIENIGIIGLGIGIGCIGLGDGNQVLAALGFAGALLHTLNHALFKSLLFYTAGIVYQATHTLNVEHLGGLIKKMPQTAILFLIAAIAISGIPPFNGFISEFIIYSGLYHWLQSAMLVSLITITISVMALVMIGGLALLCFTKAFGVVFLGNPRHAFQHEVKEPPFLQLLPLYLVAFMIVFIGLYPQLFLSMLIKPVNLLTGNELVTFNPFTGIEFSALAPITYASWGFVLLVAAIYSIRKFVLQKRVVDTTADTWGCAYVAPPVSLQYTASSFVRSYSKLFKLVLLTFKNEKEVNGIFPTEGRYETHTYDKIEKWVVDVPIKALKSFLGRFLFVQNGKLQLYIIYGIVFIVSVICIPIFYDKIASFIDILKQL
ncbi:proton-conducting transporter transmembrane domain-containing protein [Williamwhitmania taraxaci]|uniref:NADH:quinone oxidoreductase/Mrp antiporter transmembrane domain-containing protein n=1 Tax=Williamwhitmania taraxaci TaxID=1640674 RepID=A0A1G6MRU4_9BACT|nr:proton-conducting transporter membrane subunit [Williamwhitmania taraxaci]SDC58283.1 hypothetical protein SAMN05216323_10389 [Williamwhitmania taraxaci]